MGDEKHVLARIAPEPSTEDEATAEAYLRHAIASGIHWGCHSRAEQRRKGLPWIGGPEWLVHLASLAHDTVLAMAMRALMEVDPERAEQFAKEVFYVHSSAEHGEVLWDMAETLGIDASAIADAAAADPGLFEREVTGG